VTIGIEEVDTRLEDKNAEEMLAVLEAEMMDDDAMAQVWTEPIPTVNGWVSTREKSMNFVEAKKLPSWNCTTSVSESCCENEARAQMFEPGP
jgi:hypothetical protein